MIDETKDNSTNEIAHDLLPENSVTVIIKANGKVYSKGAAIGNIKQGMPDEDLNSTLRAVRGLGIATVRTIAYTIANRPDEYELPLTDVEEDDGNAQMIMLADEDIKQGDPVVVDIDKARARKATEADGVTRTDSK